MTARSRPRAVIRSAATALLAMWVVACALDGRRTRDAGREAEQAPGEPGRKFDEPYIRIDTSPDSIAAATGEAVAHVLDRPDSVRQRAQTPLEKYRSTSSGCEYREVQRDIVPDYPNCTTGRARQPTWYTYHSTGYDLYESYWFKLRDCTHSNPETSDGTWYSVRYNTKPYHCVDSLGSCYFKGY